MSESSELSSKNRRSAIDNYSIENMSKKLYRIYADI